MKWFKHFSDASSDEFIAGLEDEFGLAGYARWWKLLEVIAKQMDKTDKCSAEYSLKKWGKFLKTNQNILKTFLEHCENNSKTFLTYSNNKLTIEIPKLLEIRDNHSKNLQAAGKRLTSKEVEVEVEVEVDKEVDKNNRVREKNFALLQRTNFELLWKSYPLKKGKEKSFLKFKVQVKTEQDWVDIQKALPAYIAETEKQQGNGHPDLQYQNGSTWFNHNWKDYINFEPAKELTWAEKRKQKKESGVF